MQKVAIIGAGHMGQVHARAFSAIENAEVVGVWDSYQETLDSFCESFKLTPYDTFDSLIKQANPDVIDICTPTDTHPDLIKQCAKAGKHIICEKPLTRTSELAEDALRVCEEAGVRLFVAHVLRWFPVYRRLHDLIASGAVGTPGVVRTTRGGKMPAWSEWFTNFKKSGGVALDLIIHDFDWLRWCFGDVERVYAKGLYKSNIQEKDYALVTLRFKNGVIAHVEGDWSKPEGFTASVEVAGSEGNLNFSNHDSANIEIMQLKPGGVVEKHFDSPHQTNPYLLELEHFINCLETGEESEVTANDGLEAVRIGEAAIHSITHGKPVTL